MLVWEMSATLIRVGSSFAAAPMLEMIGMFLSRQVRIRCSLLVVGTPSDGFHVLMARAPVESVLGRPVQQIRFAEAELICRTGHVVGPGCFASSHKAQRAGHYTVLQDGVPLAAPSDLDRVDFSGDLTRHALLDDD